MPLINVLREQILFYISEIKHSITLPKWTQALAASNTRANQRIHIKQRQEWHQLTHGVFFWPVQPIQSIVLFEQ